jgi:LEA14-like dessication related protein
MFIGHRGPGAMEVDLTWLRHTRFLWLAVPALAAFAGCAYVATAMEKPRVALTGVVPLSVGLLEQRFELILRFENPNDTELNLQGLDMEVTVNDQPFASLVSQRALTLPGRGTATMSVQATTRLITWLRQMAKFQRERTGRFRYRLEGSLYAGAMGIRIPVDESGEVKLEDLLGVSPAPAPRPDGTGGLPHAI